MKLRVLCSAMLLALMPLLHGCASTVKATLTSVCQDRCRATQGDTQTLLGCPKTCQGQN
jgi:hypothetical protein